MTSTPCSRRPHNQLVHAVYEFCPEPYLSSASYYWPPDAYHHEAKIRVQLLPAPPTMTALLQDTESASKPILSHSCMRNAEGTENGIETNPNRTNRSHATSQGNENVSSILSSASRQFPISEPSPNTFSSPLDGWKDLKVELSKVKSISPQVQVSAENSIESHATSSALDRRHSLDFGHTGGTEKAITQARTKGGDSHMAENGGKAYGMILNFPLPNL